MAERSITSTRLGKALISKGMLENMTTRRGVSVVSRLRWCDASREAGGEARQWRETVVASLVESGSDGDTVADLSW